MPQVIAFKKTGPRLRWGILGTGEIAHVFCNALRFSQTSCLQAIASTSAQRAWDLGNIFNCPNTYGNYEALLRNPLVDVVYIATLNHQHAPLAIKAARAGKHILVEKPIALNVAELEEIIDAAQKAKVFLMEGFMYRCHPQMDRLRSLLEDQVIGEIYLIEASFGYYAPYDPIAPSRVYRPNWGGGALLDVGCYPISIARWIAGIIEGKSFANPQKLSVQGSISQDGIDLHSVGILSFSNHLFAQLSTSLFLNLPNQVIIVGTKGTLRIPQPWLPSSPCRFASDPLPIDTLFPASTLILHRPQTNALEEIITVEVDRDLFTYEIDTVARSIQELRQVPDAQSCSIMSWEDSLGNLEVIQEWQIQLNRLSSKNSNEEDLN